MCDNKICIHITPQPAGANLPGRYNQHTSRLKTRALRAALWLAPVFGWVLWVLDRIGHVTGWWCLGL